MKLEEQRGLLESAVHFCDSVFKSVWDASIQQQPAKLQGGFCLALLAAVAAGGQGCQLPILAAPEQGSCHRGCAGAALPCPRSPCSNASCRTHHPSPPLAPLLSHNSNASASAHIRMSRAHPPTHPPLPAAVANAMEPMLQRLLGLQTRDASLLTHQARGLEAFQRLFSARPALAAPAVGRWGVWSGSCWGRQHQRRTLLTKFAWLYSATAHLGLAGGQQRSSSRATRSACSCTERPLPPSPVPPGSHAGSLTCL